MVYKFIQQYVDNLLGFDACGLRDELLQVTMEEPLLVHFKVEEEAGRIIGCRYHSSITHRCNTVDPSGIEQEFLTGLLFQTYLCQHSCLAYLFVAFYYFGVCAFSIR